jgi:hypothetical protein
MDTTEVQPTEGVYVPAGVDPSGYLHEENADTGTRADTGTHEETRDVGYGDRNDARTDADAEPETVRQHLLAQKGIGEAKATAILGEIEVDGDRSLTSLGPRQREHLDRLVAELA